ncbi:MAG: VWA domain-containing protein [Deltaproteobacteria bacterium]|nr:MAG: VWA domain-containing protein [Deltaproteobacteria bacterium]
MRLASPWSLVLLALVALGLLFLLPRTRRAGRRAAVRYPTLATLRAVAPAGAAHRRAILGVLRVAALVLLVLALARPQAGSATTKLHREGVDVVLAVDLSGSMLAEDFTLGSSRASRVDAVKAVVKDFVAARPEDRIGLVLFSARPYTQCPLTLDHGWLLQNLDRAQVGMIEDGTAIGSALATAVNRLRASTAKSKFVVLLTDGQQNAGRITPETAAEAAAALGIKVYTVGAGTRGIAPYPTQDVFGNKVYRPMPVDIDEDTLKKVAAKTNGRYFRATDTKSLQEIYAEIDRSEKTEFEAPQFLDYRELYPWLVWPALGLVLAEVGLAETVLRKLP